MKALAFQPLLRVYQLDLDLSDAEDLMPPDQQVAVSFSFPMVVFVVSTVFSTDFAGVHTRF